MHLYSSRANIPVLRAILFQHLNGTDPQKSSHESAPPETYVDVNNDYILYILASSRAA